MKVLRFLVFFLLIIIQFDPSMAQSCLKGIKKFTISNNTYEYVLDDCIYLLKDKNGNFTIEDVIKDSYDDLFVAAKSITDPSPKSYWLRVDLYNMQIIQDVWMLSVHQNLVDKIYQQGIEGSWEEKEIEELLILSEKSRGNYISATTHINFWKKPTKRLYIKLKTSQLPAIQQKIDASHPLEIKLKLVNYYEHQNLILHKGIWQIIMQSIIWSMLVYNLSIYFFIRDNSYVYYSIAHIFLSLYVFLISGLGITELYQWASRPFYILMANFSSALALYLYFSFARSFLNPRQIDPKIDQYFTWCQRVTLSVQTFFPLVNYFLYLNFVQNRGIISNFVLIFNIFNLISLIFLFVLPVYIYRRGYQPARYFMIANFGFIFFMLIYLLQGSSQWNRQAFIGIIQGNYFTAISHYIGIICQSTLFSIALGARISFLRQENRQKQLENEALERQRLVELQKLTEDKNKELEIKVKNRTQQLEMFNEKLNQSLTTVHEQKTEIERRNNDFMDSVNYAQRIQNAILPKIQNIKDVFKQCFVVYQPKDIVAGDFYWFSDTPHTENQLETYLISVADCTGHGVPGAFMTLIGSSLLNQIVNEDNIYSPSAILTELDRRLLKTLQQQNRNEQVNDGMDIALLSIDKSKKTITFSSARRPLIYFQQGQFKEISSNRYPIGGAELKHKEFKDEVVPYQSGDIFYLYTDGFTDQFGGEKDKKFNIRRFREVLTSIQNRSLEMQKEMIENEFYLWKGSKDQTDDVLVIGIRMD